MRIFSILLATGVLAMVGCSPQNKEGENYQTVGKSDLAMKAAVEKALATTNDFVVAYRAQKPGTKNFFLKKPYPTPSGSWEHMWIAVKSEGDGVFAGIISNEAEETKAVRNGQKVFVKLDEISDWKYEDGKKLMGGYTIRYFVERMSAQERKEFLEQSGFEL